MGPQHGKLTELKIVPTTDEVGNSPITTIVHNNIQADIWPSAPDEVLGEKLYDEAQHVLPRQVTIRKQRDEGRGLQLSDKFDGSDFAAIKAALDMAQEKMGQLFAERVAQKDQVSAKTAPQR